MTVHLPGYVLGAAMDGEPALRQARREADDRTVLLRFAPLPADGATDAVRRTAARVSGLAAAALLPLHTVITTADHLVLVYDYPAGGSLVGLLAERGRLSAGEVVALGTSIAGALEVVHAAGVTHGGLSERSVFLGLDGAPYLADVGLEPGQLSGAAPADERAATGADGRGADVAALARVCRRALGGSRRGVGPAAALAGVLEDAASRQGGDPAGFAGALRGCAPAVAVRLPAVAPSRPAGLRDVGWRSRGAARRGAHDAPLPAGAAAPAATEDGPTAGADSEPSGAAGWAGPGSDVQTGAGGDAARAADGVPIGAEGAVPARGAGGVRIGASDAVPGAQGGASVADAWAGGRGGARAAEGRASTADALAGADGSVPTEADGVAPGATGEGSGAGGGPAVRNALAARGRSRGSRATADADVSAARGRFRGSGATAGTAGNSTLGRLAGRRPRQGRLGRTRLGSGRPGRSATAPSRPTAVRGRALAALAIVAALLAAVGLGVAWGRLGDPPASATMPPPPVNSSGTPSLRTTVSTPRPLPRTAPPSAGADAPSGAGAAAPPSADADGSPGAGTAAPPGASGASRAGGRPGAPGAPSTAGSAAPAASAASIPPKSVDWRRVLAGLDRNRSAAFAASDAALLGAADAPGSPALRADTALVAALRRQGAQSRGLSWQVVSVGVTSTTRTGATLRVADRMPAYRLVDRNGVTLTRRPARGTAVWQMTLARTTAGWRLAAVVAQRAASGAG